MGHGARTAARRYHETFTRALITYGRRHRCHNSAPDPMIVYCRRRQVIRLARLLRRGVVTGPDIAARIAALKSCGGAAREFRSGERRPQAFLLPRAGACGAGRPRHQSSAASMAEVLADERGGGAASMSRPVNTLEFPRTRPARNSSRRGLDRDVKRPDPNNRGLRRRFRNGADVNQGRSTIRRGCQSVK